MIGHRFSRKAAIRVTALAGTGAILLAMGPMSPAQQAPATLPAPPANGVMGFVIDDEYVPVIQGKDACPDGIALSVRDQWLALQPEAERQRLSLKENEKEFTAKWQASVFGPNGTNLCSQPDMFVRPDMRTVQSKFAEGLDLDGGKGEDSCAHQEFVSPDGRGNVDNQEYRVMGCTLNWRGTDGIAGDVRNGMRQFHRSGEWTQVLLLRGVDSLQNDPDVEIVFANTADRPTVDSQGRVLPGGSYVISNTPPRERNVLHGRIDKGVLTTTQQDIKLVQTWGQGGAMDLRGNRSKFDLRRAKLRLVFQPDGSLSGMLGGYKPVFDVFQSAAMGGAGSPLVAGIDCAQYLQTLKKYADGIKDPKTGKCTGVSSAIKFTATAAYVTDIPGAADAGRSNVK